MLELSSEAFREPPQQLCNPITVRDGPVSSCDVWITPGDEMQVTLQFTQGFVRHSDVTDVIRRREAPVALCDVGMNGIRRTTDL